MREFRTGTISILVFSLLAGITGGVVAHEGEHEHGEPVEFTASWSFGPQLTAETTEVTSESIIYQGGSWQPSIDTTSDPRLDGTLTVTPNHTRFLFADEPGGPEVWHTTFRIENDDGAWQMLPYYGVTFPDGSQSGDTGVFIGEGAYGGHFAVADVSIENDIWDLRGYIIEGEPPAAPGA